MPQSFYTNYSLASSVLTIHNNPFRISLTLAGLNVPAEIKFYPETNLPDALKDGPNSLFEYYTGAYSSGIILAILSSLSILVLLCSISFACFSVFRRNVAERLSSSSSVSGNRLGTFRLGNVSIIYQQGLNNNNNNPPFLPDSPASRMTTRSHVTHVTSSSSINNDDEEVSDPIQPFPEKENNTSRQIGSIQYTPLGNTMVHALESNGLESPLLENENIENHPDREREQSIIAELAAASHGSRCSVCACTQRGSCLPGGCFNRICCSPFVVKKIKQSTTGGDDTNVWKKGMPLSRLSIATSISFLSAIYIIIVSIEGLGRNNPLSIFTFGMKTHAAINSLLDMYTATKNIQSAVTSSHTFSYSGASGLQSLVSILKGFNPPAPTSLLNQVQTLITSIKKFEQDSLYLEGGSMQIFAAVKVASYTIFNWIDVTTILGFVGVLFSFMACLLVFLTFPSSSSSSSSTPFGKDEQVRSRRIRFSICFSFIGAGLAFASAASSLIPFFSTADACYSPEGTVISLLKNSSSDWFVINRGGIDNDDTDDKPKEGFEDDDLISDDDVKSARDAFVVHEGVNVWLAESAEDIFWRCGNTNASSSSTPSIPFSVPFFPLVTSVSREGLSIYSSWGILQSAIYQHSWSINNQKALVSPMSKVENALSGLKNETQFASSNVSCDSIFKSWKTGVDSICSIETVWIYWKYQILFLSILGLSSFLMSSYLTYFYVLTHDPTLKNLYSQRIFNYSSLSDVEEEVSEDRVSDLDEVRQQTLAARQHEDPTPLIINEPGFFPPIPFNTRTPMEPLPTSPFANTVVTSGTNNGISPLSFDSSGFGSSPGYVLSPQQVALQRMWIQQQQAMQQQWQGQSQSQGQGQQVVGGFNVVGSLPLPISPSSSIATSVASQQTRTTRTTAPAPPISHKY